MKRTISAMVGKGSVNHNSRKSKAENVDGERTHLNVDYCSEPIRQVYHKLFDEALERYNARQTRADRRIDDYYEKIRALYDRSDGFFRRQIILTARRRDRGRIDDPYLSEKLIAEKEGIFLWCLEGLRRLIAQNYAFTISDLARENMREAVSDGNNAVEFMASEGYIELKADEEISSRQLYSIYEQWCTDNAMKPLSQRSFWLFLSENQDTYNLEATNNIRLPDGKRVRGFWGIRSVLPTIP